MYSLSVQTQTFLERFFGPGNEIRWEAIVGGEISTGAAEDLASWIEDLEGFNRPVLLPCRRNGDLVQWYALAFTPQHARALREDLMAFVGPTWTCFTGQSTVLDSADPVEAAILELTGKTTYRIDVPFRDHWEDVRNSLMQMRRMWKQRPLRGRSAVRPTGRIVRDFELALQSGDLELADICMAELRNGGKLSAPNLAFLRVRRLAAAGASSELLELPELPMLLDIRRPTRVTEALLEAIYAKILAHFECDREPQAALDMFRENVLSKYAPLFRARGAIRSLGALKAFLLYAAAAHPPRPELCDAVLADYPAEAEGRSYAESLAALVVGQTPTVLSPLEQARHAFSALDFDTAYDRLLECAPTLETLQLLVATALEVGTLEAARSAIERMDTASVELRNSVLGFHSSRRDWAELQELMGAGNAMDTPCAGSIPGGWLEWINRLAKSPWPSAIEVVERGCSEWDVGELRRDTENIRQFCELLNRMSPASIEVLRVALPYLLTAFMPAGRSDRILKPVYLALLSVLALDDGIGRESFDAMEDLTKATLESDHSSSDYREVVDYLELGWSQLESISLLDNALDMLDLLIVLPCKDVVARLKFWTAITECIQNNIRRVEHSQWTLYRILSEELERGENAEALYSVSPRALEATRATAAGPEAKSVPDLKGKTIAIYTLTESVGRRAKELLATVFPHARVQISCDHVASDQLRAMAQNADYFIVVTRSAKHAATKFISQSRPSDRPLLYPAGKGTASILRSLFKELKTSQ